MHRVLEKLAKQLNAYDEDSLMMLWERYAMIANSFEPSARWEEGALVFGMLQAVRWKNQLFNYHLTKMVNPVEDGSGPAIPTYLPATGGSAGDPEPLPKNIKATILRFSPKERKK